MQENLTYFHVNRPGCAFMQSDPRRCYSLNRKYIMSKLASETCRKAQTQVDGYRLERRDRNEFDGGIVAFVRSDIPIRRRKDLEMAQTESVLLEVKFNDSKWAILCVYRPPSQSNETFSHDMFQCLDKCSATSGSNKGVKIVPKALSGAIARHSGDGKFYAMPHNEALVGG